VSVIILVVSVAIVVSIVAGGVIIVDVSDTTVESVVVSVDVEVSPHATKTVETAKAIINFFIFG
jgi:hypothetical protein